jgi:creatinine amidohydrolase
MERVPADDEGKARDRLRALREAGVETGIWWYADHPTHYAGDAKFATADAGDRQLTAMAKATARGLRAIKDDTVAKRLQDAFYTGSASPAPREPT